jgi:hypothetical protein
MLIEKILAKHNALNEGISEKLLAYLEIVLLLCSSSSESYLISLSSYSC